MNKIKVIICDDHPLISEGFQTFLSKKEDMQLVASVPSQKELNQFLSENTADVLILDIHLEDACGTEVCKDITHRFPQIKVIGLSNLEDSDIIMKMIANGASGYLVKSTPVSEIEIAIRTVHSGEVYLGREAQKILTQFSQKKTNEIPLITSREKEVLKLLAQGLSSAQAAEILFISPQTVDSHRKSLLNKFKVNKTVNLISKARELGII